MLRIQTAARLLSPLILAFGLSVASAQTDAPPSPSSSPSAPDTQAAPAAKPDTIPDTSAGKAMRRVLAAINDGKELGADAFGEAFLRQVPYDQLTSILASLREQCGSLTPIKIDKQQGDLGLILRATATKPNQPWQIILGLGENHKIDTLLFRPALADEPALADWGDLDQRLAKFSGRTNFAAYEVKLGPAPTPENARTTAPTLLPVHALNADERLAIGSTFKLYVLGALAEQVHLGRARWDEKLAIKSVYKSLPSGKMQNERDGAEFPISDYADLMISISDNTAADHLAHRVGRENIEAYMATVHGKPELNRPFLTTRELFALRLSTDPTLVTRYLHANEAVRRDMLLPDDPFHPTRPAGPTHNPGEVGNWILDPGAAAGWKSPRQIDKIEWFASAEECCRVMADLARLEQLPGMEPLGHALRINPGLPLQGQGWSKIAFKGGSEPGVMNLTYLLTRADGRLFVASIGWNDTEKPLDEGMLVSLMPRALALLANTP